MPFPLTVAYVGNFGFALDEALALRGVEGVIADHPTARLARVDPDGRVCTAAEDLHFPNGCVITPDGKTLIVAETLAFRGRELSTFGLGSLITRATHDGNFPLLAAGVLTMSLALVLLNRTVWRRLYRLAATRYALNR